MIKKIEMKATIKKSRFKRFNISKIIDWREGGIHGKAYN
jgi:hypothetical protein